MKLIKLSSATSGEFENLFNNDILIEPNSKVGLVSASVQLSDKTITIDSSNNEFEYRTQKTTEGEERAYYTATLRTGSFSQPSFLQEMTYSLNSILDNNVESSGTIQWRVGTKDSRLQLEMRRGSYNVDIVPDDLSRVENLSYDVEEDTFSKATAGEGWDGFGITKNLFTNGCGQADFRVLLTTTKFALGLIQEEPNPNITTLEPTNYDYVCYTITGEANYQISSPAGVVDSGVAQQNEVYIIMELSQGKLNFIIENAALEQFPLASFDWDYTTSYHLAFNVRSDEILNLQWSPDPFVEIQDDLYLYPSGVHTDNIIYNESLYTDAPKYAIASLTFKTKPRTGTYLGFHNDSYEMSRAGIVWNLLADEELSESVSFTDLLVELPSLTMESYDGSLSKRRPILSYIPSLAVNHSELTFFSNPPVLIDLNNNSRFNLNRVQVRLLTSAEQEVQIESASIVILIGK